MSDLTTFKENQKRSWGLFAPLEMVTTITAATLVQFSRIKSGSMLDVGCGTGVVAITAAKLGLDCTGIDLSPVLIEHAQKNASIAGVQVKFEEGDVELLPYPDHTFDAVLSQFGHMFAPRPQIAISEMLRVLKPGGIIAFSTWPPQFFMGRLFNLVEKYSPLPQDVSSPPLWGDSHFIGERLTNYVEDLTFDQGLMLFPALSLDHYRRTVESTLGPILKLIQDPKSPPERIQQFRNELQRLAAQYFRNNAIHQNYLMTRAIKKA